ncbi:hypothetical protein CE91St41_29150 [Oscillospiraceae bacterium]|nr:hypothetical protein CE91St40_29150 [Oscillospiraceae bacterium]BDF76026.1 hypothetical protein CE91St41_29150 [Oscillospiraceae bacterium]
MAFFDELRDKTMDLAQAGVAKSKQLMEIAKLNLANTSEEDAIKKAYIEIGKLYYAERGMAPDAAYVALCEKITSSKINIEENRAKINELKAESDIKDADIPPVDTEVPPEEDNVTHIHDCGCGCSDGDKPQE